LVCDSTRSSIRAPRGANAAWGETAPGTPIGAKPVYLQQFLASEIRGRSTYRELGLAQDFVAGEANMLGIIIAFMLLASPAVARDFGQWENQAPQVRKWFQSLMQPDAPFMSCCGEADAYWADSFEVDGDRYVAIITDERPDGPLGRPHRELGEKIVVPNHKIKWDDGNPTGHGIIFIGMGGQVFCYVPPGGV
jgi:hypothetical protein